MRASFQWYDGNGHFGSRLFFSGTGSPWVTADLNSFATQLATEWNTSLAQDVINTYSLVQVKVQDMTSTGGYTGTWGGTHAGTLSGFALPSNSAVNIRSMVSLHYRGGHPVLHHPPPGTAQMASNRFFTTAYTSGVRTHFQAFVAAMLAYTTGGISSMQQVAVLKWRPGGTSAQIILEPPVDYQVTTRIGTMRRRLATEA